MSDHTPSEPVGDHAPVNRESPRVTRILAGLFGGSRRKRIQRAAVTVLAVSLCLIPVVRRSVLYLLDLEEFDPETVERVHERIVSELDQYGSIGVPDLKDYQILPSGLTNSQLQWTWHRTPEGSDIFPVALFFALKDTATGRPIIESMERFGFIRSPGGDTALPIGFSRTLSPKANFVLTGVNCAACHSTQITFGGKTMHIDGGPNQIDTEAFYNAVVSSTKALLRPYAGEERLEFVLRFLYYNSLELQKVDQTSWGGDGSGYEGTMFSPRRSRFERYLLAWKFLKQRLANVRRISESFQDHTPGGPGRADSFGIIRNMLITESLVGESGNFRPMRAPVSIPHLFNFSSFTNLHWDGNTTTGNDRNYAQAIALGADFDPKSKASSAKPYDLYKMEESAWKLRPPTWPSKILGTLDSAKVARGKELFRSESCIACHERETWTAVQKIGTDPNRLASYNEPVRVAGNRSKSYSAVLQRYSVEIKRKAYEDNAVPPALQTKMDARHQGVKPAWIDTLDKGYLSRPLAGLWATAPFLHNGSVPTLWDLLQPAERRPKRFAVGHREFDPVKVGFVERPNPVVWEFDTSVDGNRNTGHDYGTTLTDDQKWDLIEYLKSL